jgi:hypothetical protein
MLMDRACVQCRIYLQNSCVAKLLVYDNAARTKVKNRLPEFPVSAAYEQQQSALK